MDSSRLLDSARDPYARRQTPSMALSSGQGYYTVESLEGASSLPLLKGSFAASAPLSSERDALVRLDAQTRALLADRETLDARTRLLAAERESLLRRNLPGHPSLADRRAYADGLPPMDTRSRLDGLPSVDARTRLDGVPPVDARSPLDARTRIDGLPSLDARSRLDGLPPVEARSRLDGLPLVGARSRLDEFLSVDGRSRLDGLLSVDARTRRSLDELQAIDPRARVLPHGVDMRSHGSLRPGIDNIPRVAEASGGLSLGALEHSAVTELMRLEEFASGARSGPYVPPADSLRTRRDIPDVRAPTMQLDSSFPQRDYASRSNASRFRGQSERPIPLRTREPAGSRPTPAETARKQNKGPAHAKDSSVKSKAKPPPEQSEGWCAVCKIDCNNIKTLGIHMGGKRHKAVIDENSGKVIEPSEESKAKSTNATSQAERKRARDAMPEVSQGAKRPKMSASVLGNGAPTAAAAAADSKKVKVDDAKKEKAKKPADQKEKVKKPADKNAKDNPAVLTCQVCNISTTGQKNLESHLKGKRHATRVKELANS